MSQLLERAEASERFAENDDAGLIRRTRWKFSREGALRLSCRALERTSRKNENLPRDAQMCGVKRVLNELRFAVATTAIAAAAEAGRRFKHPAPLQLVTWLENSSQVVSAVGLAGRRREDREKGDVL